MSDVRPGLRVEFFYYSDYEKENIHVMNSIIYDVDGKKITIAQSSPVVLKSGINKTIVVTYLVRQERKHARFGFNGKISDIITDYKIASGNAVTAVLVTQEDQPKLFNIRFNFRVRVPSSSNLYFAINMEKTTLIDISLGGAMISGPAVKGLTQHEKADAAIVIEGKTFNLKAEVVRIWQTGVSSRTTVNFAALKFINAPRLFESTLGKVIFNLERQQLSDQLAR
ncbi:MAG: Flagellar brake protein YcgR [Syntrophus sp. SKADARSKE-3]|nr:Flagellar brake protein YcgR [Syntrophus sp. SKADARSKE-3]